MSIVLMIDFMSHETWTSTGTDMEEILNVCEVMKRIAFDQYDTHDSLWNGDILEIIT